MDNLPCKGVYYMIFNENCLCGRNVCATGVGSKLCRGNYVLLLGTVIYSYWICVGRGVCGKNYCVTWTMFPNDSTYFSYIPLQFS
jgi:hypothetical protein